MTFDEIKKTFRCYNYKNNTYAIGKAAARETAIDYQASWQHADYDYLELAEIGAYFEKLGRRYGLIREFKENGII